MGSLVYRIRKPQHLSCRRRGHLHIMIQPGFLDHELFLSLHRPFIFNLISFFMLNQRPYIRSWIDISRFFLVLFANLVLPPDLKIPRHHDIHMSRDSFLFENDVIKSISFESKWNLEFLNLIEGLRLQERKLLQKLDFLNLVSELEPLNQPLVIKSPEGGEIASI